jgi:Gdp/GTP exchange factor required for growth at low temperatures
VRRLVKVAKDCKRAHTRAIEKPKACPQPKVVSDPQGGSEGHLLGKSFAEAIKKAAEEEDSDLDLDFLPDDACFEDFPSGFLTDPANAHLTVNNAVKGTAISRPTSMPLNVLQRTDAPGPHAEGEVSFVQNPSQVVLPIRHNSLSRAFVKTIGRIGRWKRVLNPKYSTQPSSLAACGAASAFDLEISAARDMLTTHGGVEEYLMMAGPASAGRFAQQMAPLSQHQVHSAPVLPPIPTVPSPPVLDISPVLNDHVYPVSPNTQNPPSVASEVTLSVALEKSSTVSAETTTTLDDLGTHGQSEQNNDTSSNIRASLNDHDGHDVLEVPERAQSFRSSSTDSFGEPLTSAGPLQPTFPGTHSQWQSQFDIVSIDDLDLSDTSSIPGGEDLHDEPVGLRKPLKKLPLRRDFEFVRRSEVSSMGIVSHDSLRDSVSSTHSETSPSSSPERGPIRRWQMKTIQRTFDSSSNDSGDKGDVEDALRRLEGQINPKVLQEKAEKVDGWVRTMQQRLANGDYDDDRSILSDEEIENFIDELDPFASDPDIQQLEAVAPSVEDNPTPSDDSDDALLSANTIVPNQIHNLSPATETEEFSLHSEATISTAVDTVPSAILRGRPPTADIVSKKFVSPSIETVLSSKFSTSKAPRIHQSFVHGYPAEELAQHFAMIDRELFIGVKFEELVSEHWMECEGIDVLDWAQFLKDRTRWKAELRFPEKTTALAALWARFNLMVNFVVSEIVLTPPSGRLALVNKFIRIAWVSSSFFPHL